MEPLSCKSCCHNPLQLDAVGTAFGYCTRHEMTLRAPHLTTCGQLLRKDLRAKRARRAREEQRRAFPTNRVSVLVDATHDAAELELVEPPNGHLPPDAVVEEVMGYGLLDSKIASIAAIHRIPGARAEIAMTSLGRGYFVNCVDKKGRWTAGVHLLAWTLQRLADEPALAATDLQGPITIPLPRLLEICRWHVVVQRLVLLSDVAERARAEGDQRVGEIYAFVERAVEQTHPGSADSLLRWLKKRYDKVRAMFPPERYEELRRELRRDDGA